MSLRESERVPVPIQRALSSRAWPPLGSTIAGTWSSLPRPGAPLASHAKPFSLGYRGMIATAPQDRVGAPSLRQQTARHRSRCHWENETRYGAPSSGELITTTPQQTAHDRRRLLMSAAPHNLVHVLRAYLEPRGRPATKHRADCGVAPYLTQSYQPLDFAGSAT